MSSDWGQMVLGEVESIDGFFQRPSLADSRWQAEPVTRDDGEIGESASGSQTSSKPSESEGAEGPASRGWPLV